MKLQSFKRINLLFLTLAALFIATVVSPPGTAHAASYSPIHLLVEDDYVSAEQGEAVVIDGTTYVPLRFISEKLGASVNYQAANRTIQICSPQETEAAVLQISTTNEPPGVFTRKGVSYIPVRKAVEALGYQVDYRSKAPLVRIFLNSATTTDQVAQTHAKALKQNLNLPAWVPKPTPKKPGKVAYLTFDDGPSAIQGKIIEVLGKYDAKATFFLLGDQVKAHPGRATRLAAEGHALGMHSMTHDKDLVYASPSSLINEMKAAQAQIKQATGSSPSILRVPYGSKPYMKKPLRDALVNNNFNMWDWNIDSKDWALPNDPQQIIENIKTGLQHVPKGEPPVLLMHEKQVTLEILPEVITLLKEKGYTLKAYHPEHHQVVNFWNDSRL
ncbi:polysaccharide deacetylase family protein [Bacillaceae bacterium SIJ1]|uniref:polysaccharide deacetylase family protein n=1 Tax=Litoribacterium kuwaitense TaxID=1398745 RepID=UPI0013EBA4BE|nr:polysaccharide deacetylase family protein [Litoribacterium kuwaitense]NGP46482.1 polysaccharide deacetylase family protein [Litoribacterium kuwaitense]